LHASLCIPYNWAPFHFHNVLEAFCGHTPEEERGLGSMHLLLSDNTGDDWIPPVTFIVGRVQRVEFNLDYKFANADSNAATGAPLGFFGCDSAAAAISRCAYAMGATLLRMCPSRPLADLHAEALGKNKTKHFEQDLAGFHMRKAAGY
jgi:hypothetical protein